MAKGTRDTYTKYGEGIRKQIEAMKEKPYVKVGFPTKAFEKKKKQRDDKGTKGKASEGSEPSLTVGEVAIFNEFGTTTGIPERSFIRATFEENKERYQEIGRNLLKQVFELKLSTFTAMSRLGQKMKADIQMKMVSNVPPPNSQETIDRKGSSMPLIDTGQMRQSVTYEVGNAGKGGHGED